MGLFHWWTLDNTVKDRYGDRDLIAWHSPSFDVGKVTQKAGRTSRGSSSNTEKTFYVSVDRTAIDTSFSVSLWINIDSDLTSGYCSPFVIGNWNVWDWYSVRFGLVYYYANNKLAFNIANGTSYKTIDSSSAGITLERHKWYHIAAIYKYGKSISLYINGKKVAEQSTNIVPILAGYYCVGGNDTDHYAFDGLINDIKVYDHALSPIEVKKLAQGLACHFSFNFEDFYTPVDYIDQVNPAAGATSEHNRCEISDVSYDHIEARLNVNGQGTSGGIMLSNGTWWKTYDGRGGVNGSSETVTMTPASFSQNTWTDVSWDFSTTFNGLWTSGWSDGTNYWTPQNLKVAYIKTYKNGELTGDFIPCVRNCDHKPGLYDSVKNKFYINQGTGADFKAPYYARAEYVESTRAQRIKLNIIPTNEYKIEETFSLTDTSVTSCLWCARGSDTDDHTITVFYIGNTGLRCDYGTLSSTDQYAGALEVNQIHTVKYDSNKWFLDGIEKITPTVENFTAGNKIELFSSYWNGEDNHIDNGAKIKMYSFKVWNNSGILVCDLVPVIDLINNEPGLYDMVEGKFCERIGSDPFLAPPLNTSYMSDCSGHGYDAQATNVDTSSDTAWGNLSGSFINSDMICTDSMLDKPSELTFGGWFYHNTWEYAGTPKGLIIYTSEGKISFNLQYENPEGLGLKVAVFQPTSGSNTVFLQQGLRTDSQLSPGWHQIYAVYDTESLKMYIDSELKFVMTTTSEYSITGGPMLHIGNNATNDRPFDGKIADIRIYATAFTGEQIKELYENRIEIDSNENLFCGNIIKEGEGIELVKENVLKSKDIIEKRSISNYKLLEYVETTGSQYINTGYFLTQKSTWEITFQLSSLANGRQMAGVWGQPTSQITTYQDKIYIQHVPSDIVTNVGTIPTDLEKHTIFLSQGLQTVDGATVSATSINSNSSSALFLGTRGGTASIAPMRGRIYSLKIWEDNGLIHYFVPAQDPIGQIGFLDCITNKFYTNKGTGSFIAGPEKNLLVKQLIEE